jgi:polyketide biosynthesis enoyl-CoA hydratase PksH
MGNFPDYQSILITVEQKCYRVRLNRPEIKNSTDTLFFTELNEVFDRAETDSNCAMVVIEGSAEVFCTGMNFDRLGEMDLASNSDEATTFSSQYIDTLRRMTLFPKLIVSKVEGQALAGGVGLVAASDIVVCTATATFGLSEAIWGLIPAMVIPYLIRKIGVQKAQWMTLTTNTINAQKALEFGLVDELVERPDDAIRKYLLKSSRVASSTVATIKDYFRKAWIIDGAMERRAVDLISTLMSDRTVNANIARYQVDGSFPWEARNKV